MVNFVFEPCDYTIVVSSRIGLDDEGNMALSRPAEMRARAAAKMQKLDLCQLYILSGGYKLGVRYGRSLASPPYGSADSDKKPDFGDKAKTQAYCFRSEASVMAQFMQIQCEVPAHGLILEEQSRTTRDGAIYTARIMQRILLAAGESKKLIKVGVLTHLYHMKQVMEWYQQEYQHLPVSVVPVFAEEVLAHKNFSWLERIVKFYQEFYDNVQENGSKIKKWDLDKIVQLLSNGKSLAEMLEQVS